MSMRFFSLKSVLYCLIGTTFSFSHLNAQSMHFLPPTVGSLSYDISLTELDNYFASGNKLRGLTKQRLKEQNLDAGLVQGKLKESTLKQSLYYQLGITSSINLGFKLAFLDRSRSSTLTTSSSASEVTNFISTNASRSDSGLGDVEAQVIWRSSYGDEHDVRFGLHYSHDNGDFFFGDSPQLSLGSGAKELMPFFNWTYYSSASHIQFDLEVANRFTLDNKVRNLAGQDVELKRSNELLFSLSLANQNEAWSYGGGLFYQATKDTFIGDVSQEDGFLQYAYRFFVGYGNLKAFETQPSLQPMEAQLYLHNAFSGINAPATQQLGIKLSTYF